MLVRVFHHHAQPLRAHHVVGRAQNPIARLVHFHDGVHALAGPERHRFGHLRRGHRIAVERQHLKAVPRQRDALVLDGARVQQMHQHAIALLHANRLARAQRFVVDRVHLGRDFQSVRARVEHRGFFGLRSLIFLLVLVHLHV